MKESTLVLTYGNRYVLTTHTHYIIVVWLTQKKVVDPIITVVRSSIELAQQNESNWVKYNEFCFRNTKKV